MRASFLLFLSGLAVGNAFVLPTQRISRPTFLMATLRAPQEMRVKEIKEELTDRKVDFSDCFDKESLVAKLQSAREGNLPQDPPETASGDEQSPTESSSSSSKVESTEDESDSPSPGSSEISEEEKSKILAEVQAMSVRDIRAELSSLSIRWAGLLEKSELVNALVQARLESAGFSATGLLKPGQVVQLTGDQLEKEIDDPSTPMLVDVFATWCGPCQLIKPHLAAVAQTMGQKVRFACMDSDQEQRVASKLRVQGLPTLILFHKGQEVSRREGALMEQQIREWIEQDIQ